MSLRSFIFTGSLSFLLLFCPWHSTLDLSLAPEAVTAIEGSSLSISRYDKLVRRHAATIGWDWRLIAAIIYHESRFHNEATSEKGATGLMQIHSTRYSTEDLLDPDFNIFVGCRYLGRLEKMYETANHPEAVKFALAAFNLGDGKISHHIEETRGKGLDATRWSNVATCLPKGHHTVAYVEKVLDTYAYYRQQYPI